MYTYPKMFSTVATSQSNFLQVSQTNNVKFSYIFPLARDISFIIVRMGGSKNNFRGGEPNIVGKNVSLLNILLLRTSLVISQIPV